MIDQKTLYTSKIFLNSVLPLFRVVACESSLQSQWQKQVGSIQISVNTDSGKWATHYIVANGEIKTHLGVYESPDIELNFKDLNHFNGFFRNETKKLPKIKGFKRIGLLILTFKTLLKMSSLLGVKEVPHDKETKKLITKLMFYLLTSGISQLNKLGHFDVSKWTKMSPDRVYALTVDEGEDIAAFIRIKAGNSKASRGRYTRSKPFFTMRFADVDSALAILLQTGDMLALTAEKKLIMEGAPEFGAKLGDFMMLVGEYIQ